MSKRTIKALIKEAKEHGLYVTESSTAIHVANNLREANNRILELERMMVIDPLTSEHLAAWRSYQIKYHTEGK